MAYVIGYCIASFTEEIAERSFLRQPGFAQAVEQDR